MNNIPITTAQIRKIKVLARRVFGGDDEGYREMLQAQAGVKSCKDLRGPKIDLVIRHLEKCLGQTRGADPLARQRRFIRELWDQVSYTPPGEERAKALNKFLRNNFMVGALEWINQDQAAAAIEALKVMARRAAGRKKQGGANG